MFTTVSLYRQTLEAIQKLERRVDKQNVMHPYHGNLLSNRKPTTDTCTTWMKYKHFTLTGKSQRQKIADCDSIYVTFPKKAKLERQKADQ